MCFLARSAAAFKNPSRPREIARQSGTDCHCTENLQQTYCAFVVIANAHPAHFLRFAENSLPTTGYSKTPPRVHYTALTIPI
jgi:hypothetical protein